ncbi:DNA repair protein complementing XP-C cells [Neosynchiropus ocellatus]
MAKRKEGAEADAHTKKLKQVKKSSRGKKSKDDDNNREKEETLKRMVARRQGPSSNRGTRVQSSSPDVKACKYFHSPTQNTDSDRDDDFDMTSEPPVTVANKEPKNEAVEDDSDEDDWEEVEELAGPLVPVEPPDVALPSQPVEIEIETPEVRKRRKRQAEFETYMKRMMNRFQKDLLVETHKVHLMCLIANGMFRNKVCNEPDLLAITLSLLPTRYSSVAKERIDQNFLSGLVKWFRTTFTLNPDLSCDDCRDPRALLERRLASLSARNHSEMTHLFLLVLRSLQLFCRLVLSLQPVPFKPPSAKGKAAKASASAAEKTSKSQERSKSGSKEPTVSPGSKRKSGTAKSPGGRGGKRVKKQDASEEEEEMVETSAGQKPKNSKRRSVASKVSYKEESDSDKDESDDEEFQAASEEESDDFEEEVKPSKKAKGKTDSSKSAAPQKRKSGGRTEEVKEEKDEGAIDKLARRRGGKKKEGPGEDQWLEVFLEKASSWVCVDVEQGVGSPHLCAQNATAPVTYVVSVDGDGFLKDLGRKYDPTWMTTSRKRRVDEEWWEETLEPFLRTDDERDRKEDKELQNRLLNKPLPISVGEYKNHPLYALKRHLLKYEAIYPSTATVLGYCRGEAVYSRDCVHTLHSRDTWLKEARTVRLGEEPYKMVRGFSNRSRKARMISETKDENDLALFGEWQTEEYQPPLAVDGKVPRNDYGNVYLFKECMLPVGCVHVRLSNLNRIARKLNLDAAPAVTGFDFHGGYSHAVTDGYIVCEEHEEILRAAWVEEQELQKQKEKEKREKRVIANWTLLVKGLLIKERLKRRYGKKKQDSGILAHSKEDGGFSSDEETTEDASAAAKSATETLAMSWPQNRQAEDDCKVKKNPRGKKGQDKHLFPFEKV